MTKEDFILYIEEKLRYCRDTDKSTYLDLGNGVYVNFTLYHTPCHGAYTIVFAANKACETTFEVEHTFGSACYRFDGLRFITEWAKGFANKLAEVDSDIWNWKQPRASNEN